jgi:hypothetical protein
MRTRSKAAGLAGALLIAVTSAGGAIASSHREAPLIAGDPAADNTDLYAFVSPDDPTSLTIIANYAPFQLPDGGPNFASFSDDVRYEIHVDNNGDALDDVTYLFEFKTKQLDGPFGPSFLYNVLPITSIDSPNWLTPQSYKLTRVEDGKQKMLANGLLTVPANIGPRSTPDYASLAAQGVHTGLQKLGATKVYAGQLDDPFFVDLGSIFDEGGLRPFNGAHLFDIGDAHDGAPGIDGVAGVNASTIAIQVPLADLTADGALPDGPNDPDAVLGVWASASRMASRTMASTGKWSWSGPWKQVSRLGNPLVNEVIIPRELKDYWNTEAPANDAQFLSYYQTPELANLVNVLYGSALEDVRTTGRDDLVAILLTGLDLRDVGGPINLNNTGMVLADMLRVNTGISAATVGGLCPAATSRLGVLEADLCGFPNGRRLADDIVDIELRAVADGYGPVVNSFYGALTPNLSPNNLVGDGVDGNDHAFRSAFPYVALPDSGYEYVHRPGAIPL